MAIEMVVDNALTELTELDAVGVGARRFRCGSGLLSDGLQ